MCARLCRFSSLPLPPPPRWSQEVAASYVNRSCATLSRESWNNAAELGDLRLIGDVQLARACAERNFAKISEQSAPFTKDSSPRPFDSAVPETAHFLHSGTFDLITARNGAKPHSLFLSMSISFVGCRWARLDQFRDKNGLFLASPAATSLPVGGWNDFREHVRSIEQR